jgi:hypothetical protein
MKIFLDDNRTPYDVFKNTIDPIYEENDTWIVVRDYYQFINLIQRVGVPKLVSFDHDLTQNHYLPENQSNINYKLIKGHTGYDAAQWLIDYCENKEVKLPEIRVHSSNLEGKRNIEELFF